MVNFRNHNLVSTDRTPIITSIVITTKLITYIDL